MAATVGFSGADRFPNVTFDIPEIPEVPEIPEGDVCDPLTPCPALPPPAGQAACINRGCCFDGDGCYAFGTRWSEFGSFVNWENERLIYMTQSFKVT